ncbi:MULTISPECIES: carbohydrate kinase family protein [Kocuria]|uniref:carbohydrate kinase family protein n=1 Tax=Kocuria TaxID=57493 RepID=UPI0006608B55|nr:MULTISPECIES: carbohydrate kinase [Kocuria]RUQ20680.1 carbohydrate kinase [Kocuria sp. HSID16901]
MLTVMGEALVDIVNREGAAPRTHPGGSPLNVAVGLSRLGHATRFIGRYGRDEHGEVIDEHLRESGVERPVGPDDAPTSVAESTLDAEGGASYRFDLDWNLESARDQLPELLRETDLLHVGSIGAMLEPGATTVVEATRDAAHHALISYDPNCRPAIIPDAGQARAWAESVVDLADVVKASDEDLLWLYPHRTVEESARAWLDRGVGLMVITRGQLGPWALTRGTGPQGVRVSPPKVTVADTVGAGDSLMAALLSALVDRGISGAQAGEKLSELGTEQLREILTRAAAAAAITVSRDGADSPTREELDAFEQRDKENHHAES